MAQDKIKFRKKNTDSWTVIRQPDEGMGFSIETTYTKDSGRVQSGVNTVKPMFTVEQYSYKATSVTANETKQLLSFIGRGEKFQMHYFSVYHGKWRTDWFYVGTGSLNIKTLKENQEMMEEISFNITGVNPL